MPFLLYVSSFLFCVSLSFVGSSAHSISFPVASVKPNKQIHSSIKSLSNVYIQRLASAGETLTLESAQLAHPLAEGIGESCKNAFLNAVYTAYAQHYPLELSVEDIWVVIAQGVSMHINANTETLRHLLVNHMGKKSLNVFADDLVLSKGQQALNWTQVVRRLCDAVKNDMKADLSSIITKRFSKTTLVQQVVFDASLLDSMKQYYSYSVTILCGIPHVTLHGSVDDFQDIIDRLEQLKTLFTDLSWWIDRLIPHIEKFKDSAQGKADIKW